MSYLNVVQVDHAASVKGTSLKTGRHPYLSVLATISYIFISDSNWLDNFLMNRDFLVGAFVHV